MRTLKIKSFGDLWRQRKGYESIKSQLLLAGKWLFEAGFRPGDIVKIRVEPGRIVIEI